MNTKTHFWCKAWVLPLCLSMLAGCDSLKKNLEEMQAGTVKMIFCEAPELLNGTCSNVHKFDIAEGTVRIDQHELDAYVGDEELSSFQIQCARPTTVVLYEQCNFQGNIEIHQCVPDQKGKIKTVDVDLLGPRLRGKVSGIVLTEQGHNYNAESQSNHAAVPLYSTGGADPVQLIGSEINKALANTGGGSGGTNDELVRLIPQCAGSSGEEAGGDIASASTVATRVFWTDEVARGTEIPPVRSGDDAVFRTDCVVPGDSLYNRGDLLAIHHVANVRLDFDNAAEYTVGFYWYFKPEVKPVNIGRRVFLTPTYSGYSVRGWSGWDLVPFVWPGDRLEDGMRDAAGPAAKNIACALLTEIKNQADQMTPGAGEAILSNRTRIGFDYGFPANGQLGDVMCNSLARTNCGDYRSVPPALVLHSDE